MDFIFSKLVHMFLFGMAIDVFVFSSAIAYEGIADPNFRSFTRI